MNSRRKTSLLEQAVLMIFFINCWKSAPNAEVSNMDSESLKRRRDTMRTRVAPKSCRDVFGARHRVRDVYVTTHYVHIFNHPQTLKKANDGFSEICSIDTSILKQRRVLKDLHLLLIGWDMSRVCRPVYLPFFCVISESVCFGSLLCVMISIVWTCPDLLNISTSLRLLGD